MLLQLCCGVVLICAGCDKAEDIDASGTGFEINKVYDRGDFAVHMRVEKSQITIAEMLLVEFIAAVKPGYEVKMPKVEDDLEDFSVADKRSLPDRLDVNNVVLKRYQYRLEPFVPGSFQLPSFIFEFYDANSAEGRKYEVSTEPVNIEVISLLGDSNELAIADIEDVVPMPSRIYLWLICAIGAIGIIAGVLVWFYLRSRRQAELIRIFKSAHEIAYERLKALAEKNLISQGKIKEFYELLSNILRHYIEHRFDLRATERTTEEFLLELAVTDLLAETDKKILGKFLSHCDLVKFAKYNPTAEQITKVLDIAKYFVNKTKSDERQVDVTDEIDTTETIPAGSV